MEDIEDMFKNEADITDERLPDSKRKIIRKVPLNKKKN